MNFRKFWASLTADIPGKWVQTWLGHKYQEAMGVITFKMSGKNLLVLGLRMSGMMMSL